jgi:glutamate 5-kinase (EC 2.7.2.11)
MPTLNSIDTIHVDDKKLEQVAGRTGGSLGSGGMYTKVLAAKKQPNQAQPLSLLLEKHQMY